MNASVQSQFQFQFQNYLNNRRRFINHALESVVTPMAVQKTPDRLHEAMRYSLLGKGKRLRPLLTLASAESVDGDFHTAMPFACALECIHAYSLIHDDLPAMDNDDLRRGSPTSHKRFDEATAILAGDALLTQAFELISTPVPNMTPKIQLSLIALLAQSAGSNGMAGGQMLDILAERGAFSVQSPSDLETIHQRKTGTLIRAACTLGGTAGGGSEEQVNHLDQYGQAVGLAFQITDDLLNETGDSRQTGKSVGSDRARNKATYPRLMGVAGARREAERQIRSAMESLSSFSESADPLRHLAQFIMERMQ